ncbi:hypothetical protein CVT24_010530 [Panaeolus cyanescens]|uniref:1-phosphatidylinositol 4-kinase n=1 Tax=Panaeolus cyanescens TaxID=181874 RepID=A0A409YYL0_9AGAR|nr:hypothetical protein CVT24_010530 [Panaeolus cyanescens]
MSSHALLLRLFLSSNFFSVHVALKYLLTYSDNIGITYYLTRRLRALDTHELQDVWGFICHLLITRPTKSRALECFVIEIVQRSTHIALITLWFMQAAIQDLSMQRGSPSFIICQRVLQKCHEIIFGDQLLQSSSPYSSPNLPASKRRQKIKHHAEPVFVGLGILLAGVPAMPKLTEVMGEVALEQGRAEDPDGNRRPDFLSDDAPVGITSSHTFTDDDTDLLESPDTADTDFTPHARHINDPIRPEDPAIHSEGVKPGLLARRRTFGAQTLPALPLHLQNIRKHRMSDDPLGQQDAEAPVAPCQSSPSFVSARTPRTAMTNPVDALLEKYTPQAQCQLLRGHYLLSEVQFLLSLENICNRLIIVPKPARVSSLRAELTALNHKLPAEVCMPLWCSSCDSSPNHDKMQPHHRIVRIPPGEAVVLNSAERAPYLLLIEVLNDDLDFDPDKRSNKEILRKTLSKQTDQRNMWSDGLKSTANPRAAEMGTPLRSAFSAAPQPSSLFGSSTAASSTTTFSDLEQDQEIDLVEQLYGDDQPLRSRTLDIDNSIVLPPAPKNRELEMAAWARSSPVITEDARLGSTINQHLRTPSRSRTPHDTPSPAITPSVSEQGFELSLDEYSERMRTAAIMLAQLNADLNSRDTTPVPQKPQHNGTNKGSVSEVHQPIASRTRLPRAEAIAIRDRIMKEMNALEEQRMERMKGTMGDIELRVSDMSGSTKSAEDENIIRRELNKVDPSAVVFSESWSIKKNRIRQSSPYGHLANWDCISVIVKTGGDLRQEQLAVQLIHEFQGIWAEEKCDCWVKYFRILITGSSSGLVETITDAVSIHSIKKAEYAKRLATGKLGHVTLLDHFISTYGDQKSPKFLRAQRNFARSLAGYSIVTYLLQIKDRHNGNILLDRDGHLIHIDFGFILSNTPGNIGFEAAPFKLPPEYVDVLGGIGGDAYQEFKALFHKGFEAARKHCDRIITLVELMQKDSMFPCFAVSGDQTANQLRDRFQPTLTHALVGDYVNRLIDSSLGSHWTRLYDSYQYYSQSIL